MSRRVTLILFWFFVGKSFAQQTNFVDKTVLYVSPNGNDSQDGLDWSRAKATIGAALAARPVNGTLGQGGYHYGKLLVAPGVYAGPTMTPWEWNAQTDITCQGAASDILASGCIIRSQAGSNIPILSSTSDYDASGFSHYLTIHGMTFDGNGTGAPQLVRQAGGGVNNVYSNVVFKNLPNGRGVWIERTAINWTCEHCAFFDLNANAGGAVYFHDIAGLNQVHMTDIQVDRCGTDPLYIEQISNATADSFTFTAIKFESANVQGSHAHIIHLKPRTDNYGNPANINVTGAWSVSTAPGGGSSFAYEEDQPGIGGRWHLAGVQASSSTYAWQSDKQNRHSASNVVVDAVFEDIGPNAVYAYVPEHEGIIPIQRNESGARSVDQIYRNDTGRTLFVAAQLIGPNTGSCRAMSGPGDTLSMLVAIGSAVGNLWINLPFYVLPGITYQVLCDSGQSVRGWTETALF